MCIIFHRRFRLHDALLSSSLSLILLSLSHRLLRYGLFHQSASRASYVLVPAGTLGLDDGNGGVIAFGDFNGDHLCVFLDY